MLNGGDWLVGDASMPNPHSIKDLLMTIAGSASKALRFGRSLSGKVRARSRAAGEAGSARRWRGRGSEPPTSPAGGPAPAS